MKFQTFRVFPGGKSFQTSDLGACGGDYENAFGRAHEHAARQAASQRAMFYVVRDDTGSQRYGFGPQAMVVKTTELYRIMQMGLASLFDYESTSWIPLDEEADAVLIAQPVSTSHRL